MQELLPGQPPTPFTGLARLWNAPASVGLVHADFVVLAAISLGEGGKAPVSAMDKRIGSETGHAMRRATLYACILKLERLGLIRVHDMLRAPSGGRPERVLALTDRGRLALEVGEAMARHKLAN